MKKAVIYARVSSTGDRQDTGRQIKDLGNYAKAQNIEIVKIYEEHISGAKKIEESFESFLSALEDEYDFQLSDCIWMVTERYQERSYGF